MKLSEAIRLGAMLKPQAFGSLVSGRGSCAWGAAYEAIGLKCNAFSVIEGYDRIPQAWVDLWGLEIACPECGVPTHAGSVMGGHLNDTHRWTREQIADWVETIERQQEQTPQPTETVTA